MDDNSLSMNDEFFTQLETACCDLIYISETDSPVEPFMFDDMKLFLQEVARESEESFPGRTERRGFDDFFDRLTADKDWHSEAKKKQTERFRNLRKLMADKTKSLEVLRQGDTRIRIFAFGSTPEGKVYGVKMISVET